MGTKIAAIGYQTDADAHEQTNAKGLLVTADFIGMHSSDLTLAVNGKAQRKIHDGFTLGVIE